MECCRGDAVLDAPINCSAEHILVIMIQSENKAAVSEYLGGEKKVFGFLMGKLIRLSGKATDPSLCKTVLENMLRNEIGQNIQSDN